MSFHPGSMSNGQQTSADTHVPKTAAEFAATDKAGMIAPSDVRGGRASCELQSGDGVDLRSALSLLRSIDRIAEDFKQVDPCRHNNDNLISDLKIELAGLRAALAPQEGTSRGGVDEKAIALLRWGIWDLTPAARLDWKKRVEEFLTASSPVPSAEGKSDPLLDSRNPNHGRIGGLYESSVVPSTMLESGK